MRKLIFAVVCVAVLGVLTTPVGAGPTEAGPSVPADPGALIGPGDPGTDQMIVHLAGRVTPASAGIRPRRPARPRIKAEHSIRH